MIMHLYGALVKSKLEYSQIVYCSAIDNNLRELDAIPNEAVRIATGALKSSPVSSMQVLVNERPLQIRRNLSSLKYFYKQRSQLKNPAIRAAVVEEKQMLYAAENFTPAFANRCRRLMNEMNIPFGTVKSAFSYRILGVTAQTWTINSSEVNFEMKSLSKNCVDSAAVRQQFKQVLSEKYAKLECIYTDGSKGSRDRPGVGSAAVWGDAV